MPRNYHQFCALSRALDVVGERWTLLIVRELLLGPRRYGELLDALPGIGTNLLAERLRLMRAERLCAHTGGRYELAERGRRLESSVLALARWGVESMAEPDPADAMRPDWYAVAMLAAYHPPAGVPPSESYEFRIDQAVFHLDVSEKPPRAARGAAPDAAFRLRADLSTFLRIATLSAPLSAAELDGDRRAARRWLKSFSLPRPVAAVT